MKAISTDNFGLFIAYLIPGFVALWGLSYFSATIRSWLGITPLPGPTVGNFLYVTLASTAAGLLVSAIRWFLLDRLHHWTGIAEPKWDFAALHNRLPAFETLVEFHYRYYQHYSNALVAGVFWYLARLIALHRWPGESPLADAALLVGAVVLFVASRDCLRKYYQRVSELLEGDDSKN